MRKLILVAAGSSGDPDPATATSQTAYHLARNTNLNGDGSFDRTVMVSEIYKKYKDI